MDTWDILGIMRTTDGELIRNAYETVLAKCDRNENPELYQEICKAYEDAMDYATTWGFVDGFSDSPDIISDNYDMPVSDVEENLTSRADVDFQENAVENDIIREEKRKRTHIYDEVSILFRDNNLHNVKVWKEFTDSSVFQIYRKEQYFYICMRYFLQKKILSQKCAKIFYKKIEFKKLYLENFVDDIKVVENIICQDMKGERKQKIEQRLRKAESDAIQAERNAVPLEDRIADGFISFLKSFFKHFFYAFFGGR